MHGLRSAFAKGLLAFALAAGAAACGGPLRYTPRPTPRAPEADTVILATVNQGQGNATLEIRVEHLAPPDRIQAGGTAYVVWTRRNQNAQWIRVGTLQYNPSSRSGLLNTTAPDTSFELQITVENSSTPTSPSANVVVTQMVGAQQPAAASGS